MQVFEQNCDPWFPGNRDGAMMINELVDGGEGFVRPQEILTVSIGQDFEMLRAAAMSEKKKSALMERGREELVTL